MTVATPELDSLLAEIRAMGNIPLLPPDDLLEYSRLCQKVFDTVDAVTARNTDASTAIATADALYTLARTMRQSGDDLSATELLVRSSRYCQSHGLRRQALRAHHSTGITLYHLGEYDRAKAEFDVARSFLDPDGHGAARSLMIDLNCANLLHYVGKHDEAEHAYRGVLAQAEHLDRTSFETHSAYSMDRFVGLIFNNLAANRNEWAESDRTAGAAFERHLAIAEATVKQSLSYPLSAIERIQAQATQAHTLILRGQLELAEVQLRRLAAHCADHRDLVVMLPELYRYAAEACAARGDARQALLDCYRALESSLAVASRLQERRVVDTFVDVLKLSSGVLFDPTATAMAKVEQLGGEASGVVDTLIDFLERKDWYTGHNHSKSVATVSLRMARALQSCGGDLGETARREIHLPVLKLAADLHDIGKLTVPWSLLNKIMPITEGERAILKTHPEAGKRLLDRIGLNEIGDIIVEHHECPDGSGYPTGKRDSSLMGSIIAVADAFEAMTSVNRRYRTPMKKDQALAEVQAKAGVQFDERVAQALERSLSSPSANLSPGGGSGA